MEPKGHFSKRSLLDYAAGDLFDKLTGTPVTPYGIDLYDYEVNGRITEHKGAYNTLTGKKAAGDFKELEAMLKAEGRKLRRLAGHEPPKEEKKDDAKKTADAPK